MDKATSDKYQPVIGLEVHAQLLTNSKIYSADPVAFGGEPNAQVGVVTLAHPGTLPKLNKRVVEQAIKMGLACHSEISRHQVFDRKNYFYPDLPKGYQLTQDRTPICKGGHITIRTKHIQDTDVPLNRIHIEEDAGKSIHLDGEEDTLIDLNRAGVPLIEIVTLPVIGSAAQAGAFYSEVRKLVRYLGICDGNMEEGSLRCDANISIKKKGDTVLGKKVEVKNMNSIRNLQRAIEHEIERQVSLLEEGGEVVSETRAFNVGPGTTSAMRTKEELNDYRYFPDPDLSPLHISDEWISEIRKTMPALPEELYQRFVRDFSLPQYDALVLTESREMAEYYLAACRFSPHYKAVSNWVMGPVKSYLNDKGIDFVDFPVAPGKLSELVGLVVEGKVGFANAAQKLLPALIKNSSESVLGLAARLHLVQDSDEGAIGKMVEEVLHDFPAKVMEYKKGKKGLISMFMGEIMKKSQGKADPKMASSLLQKKLSEI